MTTNEDFSVQRFMRVSDIAKEPQKMLMPISGYEDAPLVSLEEAVVPLVSILPRIRDYVYVAKQRCEPVPADGLTRDESSSIMLYTMSWKPKERCLYFSLNATLRSEDREKLKPWFSYLKLILTALSQLPSNRHFVYRGVKMDLSEQYPKGQRTLFTIDCDSGKDISRHSYFQSEEEVLLLAARQFMVKACSQLSPDLHMIQLKEVEAPICLLQLVIGDSNSKESSTVLSNKCISTSSTTVGKVLPPKKSILKANPNCLPEREINILLLGPTGVGKTTFINAFANYVVNDTLQQAVNDEMQVVISSSFSYEDRDTFDDRMIVIGNENEYGQLKNVGESNTQLCRSFVFPIGSRNLRFIDTPGIGDTKGLDQDEKNFQEILHYIAQFEHLNAVFIMLKSHEERSTILRYSVYEILRHLNVNAKNNIVFIFTNARSTFFMPGSTKILLNELLDELRTNPNVEIPFTRDNTFLFDSEPFRYLALCTNGIRIDNEQTQGCTTSWNHSVTEYSRLMKHINSCDPFAISDRFSLNEAGQLVRKLPRPIAETARLIEENIQLAKEHKKKVLENPQIASQEIPQKAIVVEGLSYPRTVCTGEKCCRVTGEDPNRKVEYISICHDKCYLTGVIQETSADRRLRECEVMDPKKDFCTVCGCDWEKHKHITYECNTRLTHVKSNTTSNSTTNIELSLDEIDKHIHVLQDEQAQIQDVYKKLVRFLHANSIFPINHDFLDYLQYFIREEQMKQSADADNTELISNLEKMIKDYKNEMESCKRILEEQEAAGKEIETLSPDEVFILTSTLYHLPINGNKIRAQVNEIAIGQRKWTADREKFVELPVKAASSKLMLQLRDIVSAP